MIRIFDDITETIGNLEPGNSSAHHRRRWRDTDGRVDFVVAGVGTVERLRALLKSSSPANPRSRPSRSNRPNRRSSPAANPARTSCKASARDSSPDNLNTKILDEVIRVNEEAAGPISQEVNQLDGIQLGFQAVRSYRGRCKSRNGPGKRASRSLPSCPQRVSVTAMFRNASPTSTSKPMSTTSEVRTPGLFHNIY